MLRKQHDTKVPTPRSAIGASGLPLGVLLALHFGLHGVGIWIGLSPGLPWWRLLLARWLRRDRLAPPLAFEH